MPVSVKCPNCNRALRVPDEQLGKRVKCPACSAVFGATAEANLQNSGAKPQGEEMVRRKRPPAPEDEEEPAPPVRKKAIRLPEEEESFDEPEAEYREETRFPMTVMAAGIFWIVLGAVLGLVLLMTLAGAFLAAQGREEKGDVIFGGLCGGLFIGLIGAAFIFVGVQTVLGTARDTLGNGIGSIVFGVLNGSSGLGYALKREYLLSVVSVLCGVGLVTAGVLALVGRDRYKAWRRARRPRRRRKVRR